MAVRLLVPIPNNDTHLLTILLKTIKPSYYRYVLGTLHGTLKKGKIPLARGPPSPPTPDGIAASLPSWLRASVPYDKLSEPHTHRCWGCHQSNTTHTVQALSAECQGSRKQEGGNQRER